MEISQISKFRDWDILPRLNRDLSFMELFSCYHVQNKETLTELTTEKKIFFFFPKIKQKWVILIEKNIGKRNITLS